MMKLRVVSLFFALCLLSVNAFSQTKESLPKPPKSIKELDGAWTWDWGQGKTAFIIKNGKVKDLPISFKLMNGVLREIKAHTTVDLKLQPDGSWKGVEAPTKFPITMKKVELTELKAPKSVKEIDGQWVWQWNSNQHVYNMKKGRYVGDKKIKFKLKKHILTATIAKKHYVDLILQPNGSWLGIESPTGFVICFKKLEK